MSQTLANPALSASDQSLQNWVNRAYPYFKQHGTTVPPVSLNTAVKGTAQRFGLGINDTVQGLIQKPSPTLLHFTPTRTKQEKRDRPTCTFSA